MDKELSVDNRHNEFLTYKIDLYPGYGALQVCLNSLPPYSLHGLICEQRERDFVPDHRLPFMGQTLDLRHLSFLRQAYQLKILKCNSTVSRGLRSEHLIRYMFK